MVVFLILLLVRLQFKKMVGFVLLINFLLNTYLYIMVAAIIMNWLVTLGVINIKNKLVQKIYIGLHLVTEPVLAKIRRLLPPFAGLDFSPIVVFIAISVIQRILFSLIT